MTQAKQKSLHPATLTMIEQLRESMGVARALKIPKSDRRYIRSELALELLQLGLITMSYDVNGSDLIRNVCYDLKDSCNKLDPMQFRMQVYHAINEYASHGKSTERPSESDDEMAMPG